MKRCFFILIFISNYCFSQNSDDSLVLKTIDFVLFSIGYTEKEVDFERSSGDEYFHKKNPINSNRFIISRKSNPKDYCYVIESTYNSKDEVDKIYYELKAVKDFTLMFGKSFSLMIFHENKVYEILDGCGLDKRKWINISNQLNSNSIFTKQLLNCYCGGGCGWDNKK